MIAFVQNLRRGHYELANDVITAAPPGHSIRRTRPRRVTETPTWPDLLRPGQRFPPLWSEWNGRYRDVMRDFWPSHDGLIGEFAARFAGSADLYGAAGRRPTASVNLITVHDGFTLADLVSHDTKHNGANGEDNRDGTDGNRSWNCGAEGPTADPGVLALRARQSRALLITLLLSFGCRCSSAATRSAGPSGATTTPTARTTRSAGSTGPLWTDS